jgi:HK97 family phage portal protein
MPKLIDRVRRPAPKTSTVRADPVTLEEFGYLLSGQQGARSEAGVNVTESRIMGVAAWYSGVRYITETIAGLPVHTYRDRPDGTRERRADPPWMLQPDGEQTWFGLVEHWLMSLLHRGNGYSFKLRNPAGMVVGLRELHPDRLTHGIAPDNSKRFMIDRDERVWTRRDVLHIPALAFDGRFGLNPIRANAPSLGGVVAADSYAQRFFGQGTHVGGIINIPEALTPDEASTMRAEWERFHTGLREAHQTGVLSGGATYQPLALNAEDAQLLESRTFGINEIARILRLPPHKLYELSRATFSNIEHQAIEAITDGILPWVNRLEEYINADPDLLPPGNYIEFSLEGLLRGDTAARFAAYQQAVGMPWMSVNEARRLENRPPVDGGDEVAKPLNMQTGETDGMSVPELTKALQQIYLAVGSVITADEAREILNRAGADLADSMPRPMEVTA